MGTRSQRVPGLGAQGLLGVGPRDTRASSPLTLRRGIKLLDATPSDPCDRRIARSADPCGVTQRPSDSPKRPLRHPFSVPHGWVRARQIRPLWAVYAIAFPPLTLRTDHLLFASLDKHCHLIPTHPCRVCERQQHTPTLHHVIAFVAMLFSIQIKHIAGIRPLTPAAFRHHFPGRAQPSAPTISPGA